MIKAEAGTPIGSSEKKKHILGIKIRNDITMQYDIHTTLSSDNLTIMHHRTSFHDMNVPKQRLYGASKIDESITHKKEHGNKLGHEVIQIRHWKGQRINLTRC